MQLMKSPFNIVRNSILNTFIIAICKSFFILLYRKLLIITVLYNILIFKWFLKGFKLLLIHKRFNCNKYTVKRRKYCFFSLRLENNSYQSLNKPTKFKFNFSFNFRITKKKKNLENKINIRK